MPLKNRKKPRKSNPVIFIIAILLFSLPSCSDEKPRVSEPQQALTESKKTGDKPAEKKSEQQPAPAPDAGYTYNPSGKIDPFMPLIINVPSSEQAANLPKEKKEVPLSPLQKLDVDDFTLVAVIYSDTELKALLEDPAMNGFIVKEGMHIGRNDGVIKKILHNSVIVEEQETDPQGNSEKKIQTITLKKK